MMFFLYVEQRDFFLSIEIRMSDKPALSGALIATAHWDFDDEVARAYVYPNVVFGQMSIDHARKVIEWFRVATVAAEWLRDNIKTRDDFKVRYTARMVSRTITIEKVTDEN